MKRGDFIMFLKISQLNGPLLPKKKKKKPTKYKFLSQMNIGGWV
jgi:hypothetical protein